MDILLAKSRAYFKECIYEMEEIFAMVRKEKNQDSVWFRWGCSVEMAIE